MNSLTVGSLFSGIGGLELGLERAGMKTIWQVEKNEYARKVLTKHWPQATRYEDVKDVGAKNLAPVDLICGGFPCQDISNAGKRAGLEGKRSGLWSEFHRIVDELRPPWVLIENVAALRSRGLSRVLSDPASSGYDAEWDGLPASAFGAPHRRDRLFVVAYSQRISLRLQQGRSCWQSGTGASQGQPQPRGSIFEGGRRVGDGGEQVPPSNADGSGLEERRIEASREELTAPERGGLRPNPWAVEPDVGRVAHGVPKRVDRLRCLGNAVVPQVAQYIGALIVAAAGGGR